MVTRNLGAWLRPVGALLLLAVLTLAQATTILPVFVEPGGGRDVEFRVFGDVGVGFPAFSIDLTRTVYTPTSADVGGRCTAWGTIHCDFFAGKYSLVLKHAGTTSDFITVDWGSDPTLNDDGSVSVGFNLHYYSGPFADGFDEGLFAEFPVVQSFLRTPESYCERVAVRPDLSCRYEQEFFYPFGLSSGFGIVDLAPIPQPSTPALLGTALLGLLWFRRRVTS